MENKLSRSSRFPIGREMFSRSKKMSCKNSLNLHICCSHSRDVSTRPRDAWTSLNMTGSRGTRKTRRAAEQVPRAKAALGMARSEGDIVRVPHVYLRIKAWV